MIDLRDGDILFQDVGCGAITDAIEGVARGHAGAEINHCGIVSREKDGAFVIEAIFPRVRRTPLARFLDRSLDERQRPRVLVGRVAGRLAPLVPAALDFCRRKIGAPYDPRFAPDDSAFYCSELIVDAFRDANGGAPVFPERPMTFRDRETGEPLPFWTEYFARFGTKAPQDAPGSNPATLSRDPAIAIVAQLGDLRGAPSGCD